MKSPLKILLFSLLLIYFPGKECFSQFSYDDSKYSKKIKSLLKKFAEESIVYSSLIGIVGSESPTWDPLVKLSEIADTTQLIELTNHPDPVLRCYCFQALTMKKHSNVFPLVVKHISDSEAVRCLYADVMFDQTVGDFFIDKIKSSYTNAFDYAMENDVSLD